MDIKCKEGLNTKEILQFNWTSWICLDSEWTNERPNDKKLVGTEEDIIKFKFRGHGGEDYILLSVLIN